MKNLLKITLISAGFFTAAVTASAQENIKTDASKTAAQLEAPAQGTNSTTTTTTTSTNTTGTNKQDPAKGTQSGSKNTAKQEPAKTTNSSKSTSKADSTKTNGGTRMAITEQGMPKQNKNKGKKSTAATTPPAEPKK